MGPFLWEKLTPKDNMAINLATGGGVDWTKWLKNGAGKVFIFHAIISTLLVKILLVKLK